MPNKEKQVVPVTTGKQAVSSWPIMRPLTEMERAFDRFLERSWPSLWGSRNLPALAPLFEDTMFEFAAPRLPNLDVIDRDGEILVRAEVPGFDKKDLNISLSDNLLTIKGQTSSEKKEEKGDYYRNEISSSSFSRSITLASSIDASKVESSLKDGLLEITLPKVESAKKRNIAIK